MNFLALKYFKEIATELNITHVAQKLYVSQQALSFHIKNLETELGVELFNRSPKLSLTDAGKYLLDTVNEMNELSNNLNDKLNDIRNEVRGELRIGLSFTRGQYILPSILPQYTENHPQVHINIFEESSNKLLEKLLRGEIDFWITAENHDIEGIQRNTLFSEKFLLVVPKKILEKTYGKAEAEVIENKLKTNFELGDIIECPFVLLNPGNRSRDLFDNAIRSEKLTPNILLETENSQTAFALAQKEMALTVYSDMFLRNYSGKLNKDVLIIPFEKYLGQDELHVYYTGEVNNSKYKKAFLETMNKAF